jgi:hypothetical protein
VTDRQGVIAAIDAKIAELQRELERLRRAAELIPLTETNLEALQRTRAVFLGEPVGVQGTPDVPRVTLSQMIPAGSTGALTLEILGRLQRPVHISALMRELREKGSQASQDTVTSMLSRYKTNGCVKRVATSTYTLGEVQPLIRPVESTLLQEDTPVGGDLSGNSGGTNNEGGELALMNELQ